MLYRYNNATKAIKMEMVAEPPAMIDSGPNSEEAQKRFDDTYITSSEICSLMKVTRPTIHLRRKAGHLPGGIAVYGQQLVIWERITIKPFLDEWEKSLKERRGETE